MALYEMFRGAWPFRDLARTDFDAVVQMPADGFATRRGRRGALIHRDAVHQMLRARRGARTTALTSGGTFQCGRRLIESRFKPRWSVL